MTLTDKMKAWEPAAVWSEAGEGMFTVPAEAFRGVAERLKAEGFDFLRSLTGMDWGEEGFGVVYHLEASSTGENVVVRTLTPERERPVLPSVCDLWRAAELNEREAFDYFGIRFLNHPDMRRLYLRDDWVGHPLRKDYDPASNPLRMSNEVSKDSAPTFELQPDGSFIRGRNVLFEEEEYVINVGPQHPATHGVLRFRVSLEGEIIKKLDVHCGYIHRGIEKMCEELTYPQTLALTDRLDYLGASQNRHALCMCIEKGLGVEVPERVQYIRTIMDELQRIDSHLLFFACLCMDMGALTAFFYGFRDREKVLDILEQTTGGRLIQTYNTIGGVQADIHPDFVRKVKEFIAYMRPVLREYHEIFTGNVIAQERLKGTGVLTREDAISFGATGGTGRAAGWACDVRKRHPYAVYGKVDFEEVLFTEPGPLHGPHAGDRAEHEHHRAVDRQHSRRRIPVEDEARDPHSRGQLLRRRRGKPRRVRGLHREPGRQVPLPHEVPLDGSAARLVPGDHRPGDEDRRPDRHRRHAGLRGSGY